MHLAREACKDRQGWLAPGLLGCDTLVFPHLCSHVPGSFGLESWMGPFQDSVAGTGKMGEWKMEVKTFPFSIPTPMPSVPGLLCSITVWKFGNVWI